ncbi:hypothetical protein [Lutibacter sp.]|uniref:hypothetical protein n=1 Tax=Lutibacter sp. TaxID=1925666 RepID=UPI0025C321FE|nr:hypothetical protein [Lutibacter sp.]MCF6182715.1 hypothetical protein [Lutibacter sp.]
MVKRFFIITILFISCSTTNLVQKEKKCKLVIHDISSSQLREEINIYKDSLKLKFLGDDDKFILVFVEEKDGFTIYNIQYGFDFDDNLISRINLVSFIGNLPVFFILNNSDGSKDNLKIQKCAFMKLCKKLYPENYKYYKTYNSWPMPSSGQDSPIYKLIFKNGKLIKKKFYKNQ